MSEAVLWEVSNYVIKVISQYGEYAQYAENYFHKISKHLLCFDMF